VERFARQDVPGLFDEALARVGWELAVFLAADPDDDRVTLNRLAVLQRVIRRSTVIESVCEECWRVVKDGLTAMDGKQGWRLRLPERDVVGRWSDDTKMFSWKEPDPWDFSGEWHREEFVELFDRRIYETLRAEARRLRICLECRKAFVANGRQQYCRRGCSQTRSTRDWRKRHPEKVKISRSAAYDRQIRKTVGPKVKVQRRSSVPVVQ
jgi:hypothetical protein